MSKIPPVASDGAFNYNSINLYIPTGCRYAYMIEEPWRRYNIIEMTYTGVDDIFGDDDNVTVSVANGEICINGADAYIPMVEVYTINGACIYRGSDTRISNLARGVYVVRIGSKTIKVVL